MRWNTLALGALAALACLAAPAAAGQDDTRAELVRLGQLTGTDSLRTQLRTLLQEPDRAKKLLSVAVQMAEAKDPDLHYNAALLLAQVAEKQKDYKALEALYRVCADKAVKLYSTRKILQSYGGLADALYKAKRYADAVKVCREVLELVPPDKTPRKFLFIEDDKFGDFGFKEDPEFDLAKPLHNAFYQVLIQSLAREGKTEQALKMVEGLIRKNEDQQFNWEDRELKGWVLREAGRLGEAAKVYEDVIDRINKDRDLTQEGKDYFSEIDHHILSNLYVELKQIDKATVHLQWLMDKHPDDPGVYNDMGYIWADADMKLPEAEKLIRKALELDKQKRMKSPDFNPKTDRDKGAYLDSLGWVLFKQKKYEEAKKILQEALKDDNAQHIEIYDHLGDCCLALGQVQEALAAWRRGIEVAGDDRRERERKTEVEKKIQQHSK